MFTIGYRFTDFGAIYKIDFNLNTLNKESSKFIHLRYQINYYMTSLTHHQKDNPSFPPRLKFLHYLSCLQQQSLKSGY